MARNWTIMLLAILIGNTIYWAIHPHLPRVLAHSVYRFDTGLLLDLAICAALYVGIKKVFG